jgi:hypothetical protein
MAYSSALASGADTAALKRFFADDHLTATHILLSQVECALRNLLGLLRRPTNKAIRGDRRNSMRCQTESWTSGSSSSVSLRRLPKLTQIR